MGDDLISLVLSILIILLVTVLFPGAISSGERYSLDYNPHEFLKDETMCGKCHNLDEANNVIEDEFVETIVDFCHGCHGVEELGRSHPIGIDPTRKYWKLRLPEDFHLDIYNNMTCITCHTGHGRYLSLERSFPSEEPVNPDARVTGEPFYYKTYYVRRSDPEEGWYPLCTTCHEEY
jgi:cytochrome c553